MRTPIQNFFLILLLMLLASNAYAQDSVKAQKSAKNKISFKDSLDHAFDVSDYMIYKNGFIVIPVPITEPSLGGIGGSLVPVFITKRKPVIDTVNGKVRIRRVNPDITGAMFMYTANNSWMAAAFRMGTFAKAGIKYRVLGGYGNMNISFYHTFENLGEQKFNFNFKILPVYLQLLKQFNNPRWSAGLQYVFITVDLGLQNGSQLPDFVKQKEVKSTTSQPGAVIQYDSRDNIFTPNKGLWAQGDFFWSNSAFGSDFDAWRINYSAIGFTPFSSKLIAGLRLEGTQSLGDPPFYGLPYINLRGVPAARYQGKATLVTETEFRWDLYRRWSAVFYTGVGAAYDNWGNMFEKPLVYNYGTGFRYLIARKFKLRMGVDVARGPEVWAYYVVFGSSWFR